MVPIETTIAVVEEEMVPLAATAARRGWVVAWQPDLLKVIAEGPHPADHKPVRLQADVTDYRSVPPAWTFLPPNPSQGEPSQRPIFPKPGQLPGEIGSIFHSNRLICAPFSRLAYNQHGGPHGDWGGPSSWLNVKGYVQAVNLAEMFALIWAHLRYSPGWYE
jgi:hypothetical protein